MRGDAAWRARGHAPGMPSACPRRAAAKAKAAPMGRQPRHGHAAAKAWACSSQGQGSPPWALSSQGMSTQHPRLGRARSSQGLGVHAAAKAGACMRGRAGMPLGALACPWAQAAGPLGARRVPEGQWQHGEGVACPVGGMPRPWHALGTPRRPWQHLGGLLLPSLDSLFGHLPTLPPLKSA